MKHRLRAQQARRFRTVLSTVIAGALILAVTPLAHADDSTPSMALSLDANIVVVEGIGFGSAEAVHVSAATVSTAGEPGAGSTTILSQTDRSFRMGFVLPSAAWTGKITVTANSTSLKATATIQIGAPPTASTSATTTVTTSGGTGAGIPGNWKVAFDDEFNGTTLDLTKWTTCDSIFFVSCRPANDELEHYNTDKTNNPNVVVSNGKLHLVATKVGSGITSGMVSTGPDAFKTGGAGYKSFQYTYGYYESRVRVPTGDGLTASAYEQPDQSIYGPWATSGQTDAVKVAGNEPQTVHLTEKDVTNGGADNDTVISTVNAAGGFHTYGVDWEPGTIKWYVDGALQKTLTSAAVKNLPMYLSASLAVGGSWASLGGAPDATTAYPASMDIDWVRVYEHS